MAIFILAAVVCSTVFADYWAYSKTYHSNPDTWMDVIRGTASAPQQYRIGVPIAADFIRRFAHVGLRHGFTIIDLLSTAIAVTLLYGLFYGSKTYREAAIVSQWFGTVCFAFFLQYYLFWITWYQKPETLASTAALVCTVWLVKAPLGSGGRISESVAAISIVALAAVQAFIRADVIFAFHVGLILALMVSRAGGFAIPRTLQFITSGLAIVVSGGIQYWLIHVVYPHATYGNTDLIQLVQNLTNPIGWIPFALFLFPSAWLYSNIFRPRTQTEGPDMGLALGSLLYLGMWFAVGRIEEVRIFLPYAVALIPLTCECAMRSGIFQSPTPDHLAQSEQAMR